MNRRSIFAGVSCVTWFIWTMLHAQCSSEPQRRLGYNPLSAKTELTTGARVPVRYGGKVPAQAVLSQSSIYSGNDPRLHFVRDISDTTEMEIYGPMVSMKRSRWSERISW
jgi:hypothetical protein